MQEASRAALVAAVIVAVPVGGTVGAATPHRATAQTTAPTCQRTTPLGLSGAWKCTFDDEFIANSLNTSLWQPQVTAASGYVAGADCYANSPSTISVSGGCLNRSARKSHRSPGHPVTPPNVPAWCRPPRTSTRPCGAFEVNAKLPPSSVSGLQETFSLFRRR